MALPDIYKYIPLTAIQQPFVNKDTGEPLAGGYVYFYKDEARTTFKDVFKFSGTPSDPAYSAIANPVQLGIAGTPIDSDNGNDLLIYGFPFDSEGDPELYFVQCYDSIVTDPDAVLQFTRESYPEQIPQTDTPANISFINNIVPNGQFITYETPGTDGTLTENTTPIAMGGWTFYLSNGFTSTNTVSFITNYEPSTTPESNPINILNFECTDANPAESQKDLAIVFPNVNFLENKNCTFQFEAKGVGVNFNLQLIEGRFYGTDGSDYEENVIQTFTITQLAYNKYLVNFTFNDNTGKVVTSDSELRLILRFPLDTFSNCNLVNFILVEGDFSTMIYPDVSQYQAVQQAIAGSIKIPDQGELSSAFDNGKFLQYGLDNSTITPRFSLIPAYPVPTGTILPFGGTTPPTGFLENLSQSLDLTSANPSATNYDALYGVIGTNFGYGVDGFIPTKTATATLTHEAYNFGTATAPSAGTSGFTITVPQVGDSTHTQIVQVVTVPGSSITAGSFYKIYAPSGRSTVYWFSVNGIGTAPSSPGSLIKKISITTAMTADQVAQAIVDGAICQYQLPPPGYFIRGWNHGSGNDPDAAARLNSSGTKTVGDVVGSFQTDALQNHKHSAASGKYAMSNNNVSTGSGSSHLSIVAEQENTGLVATTDGGNPTDYRTSTETRPKNYYALTMIKT